MEEGLPVSSTNPRKSQTDGHGEQRLGFGHRVI
jgi:hypothetical protein